MEVTIETTDWMDAPAPAERPCFGIGDVHGRDDLLSVLLAEIDEIVGRDGLVNPLVVGLGDYIDRGPDSISALKRVLSRSKGTASEFVALPGNHEQYLATLLTTGSDAIGDLIDWFDSGGSRVARELGFLPDDVLLDMDPFIESLRAALGPDHIQQFLAMPNHVRSGRYLFVHAGLHPHLGLKMLERDWRRLPRSWFEEDQDPLWVRGPFLTYDGAHEDDVIVVHGHTPHDDVEVTPNRINTDTRAWHSGRLTAAQVVGSQLRFIVAAGQPHIVDRA